MPSHRNKTDPCSVNKCGLVCGIIYAVIGLIVRICTKSPYNTIHVLGADVYLPPLWIFNLLCLFWLFVSGFAAGITVGKMAIKRICGREEISAYRGLLTFICLFFLSLLWYPLFFGGERLALSLLVALLCVICSSACGLAWRSVVGLPGLLMGANALWQFYVLLVNLLVILHN